MTAEPLSMATRPSRRSERLGGTVGRAAVLAVGLLLLAVVAAFSLFIGAGSVAPGEVVDVLSGGGEGEAVTIVLEMRVPRGITAVLVGGALGLAGAIMQLLTRNPLADPGLLGVNAGAGLAVVLAVGVLGLVGFDRYVWFAIGGAFVVSLFVYAVGLTVGRDSPFTVVLAGVAVTAVLTGISTGLAILDPARFNVLRGWMAGNVAGRDLDTIGQAALLLAVGAVIAAVVTRPLSQLALGEDAARMLGVRVGITRLGAAIAVMLLAGAGTALAGPILFIGLMVPHIARALVGPRAGWAFCYSAIAGAMLLLIADILGRVLIPPGEAPAGLLTAILGAPVLALLARRRTEAMR